MEVCERGGGEVGEGEGRCRDRGGRSQGEEHVFSSGVSDCSSTRPSSDSEKGQGDLTCGAVSLAEILAGALGGGKPQDEVDCGLTVRCLAQEVFVEDRLDTSHFSSHKRPWGDQKHQSLLPHSLTTEGWSGLCYLEAPCLWVTALASLTAIHIREGRFPSV